MYDITSIVDGRNTVATSENVRSVEKSAGQSEKTEDQPKKEKTSEKAEVKQAVTELNAALDSLNVKREFSIEESSNEVIVKIINSEDKKLIRQIPSEETLRLSQNIREMVGLLFDSTS